MAMTWFAAQTRMSMARSAFKPIGNNTWLHRLDNGDFAIKYHRTDIVIIRRDGTYVLNTRGWNTTTTRRRLNEYSPASVVTEGGDRDGSGGTPYVSKNVVVRVAGDPLRSLTDALASDGRVPQKWLVNVPIKKLWNASADVVAMLSIAMTFGTQKRNARQLMHEFVRGGDITPAYVRSHIQPPSKITWDKPFFAPDGFYMMTELQDGIVVDATGTPVKEI